MPDPAINPVTAEKTELDTKLYFDRRLSKEDKVFGKGGLDIDHVAKAIATFERTLVSTNSKFDNLRCLDTGVLSSSEIDGFQTFRQHGCLQCHMGPDFSGPPPLARGAILREMRHAKHCA